MPADLIGYNVKVRVATLGVATFFPLLCVPALAQCPTRVWSGLDGGGNWEVRGLASHDEDGSGPGLPALFISGGFTEFAGFEVWGIVRWDGWEASQVGGGLTMDLSGLEHLRSQDEWAGQIPPGLYAGGEIDTADGFPVNNLTRWESGAWHDVGGGVSPPPEGTFVFETIVFDEDAAGPNPPSLFVGGQFSHAGAVPVKGLARWDGRTWSAVGGGIEPLFEGHHPWVKAFAIYDDDGPGPRQAALYVGGKFKSAGGVAASRIARWDGRTWEAVGGGLSGSVESLCVYDEDGPGPKNPYLFAGGQWGVPDAGIRRYDGVSWTSPGGGTSSTVLAMIVWDEDGPGPLPESLYAGGLFIHLPNFGPANKIARWDGTKWWPIGKGVSGYGAGTSVRSMALFDEDGPGPIPEALYVGGLFLFAGDTETHHVARYGCPLPPTTCKPDCDLDGSLSIDDFVCFQTYFALSSPAADCEADGDLDIDDFICFQTLFAVGCP